MEPTVFSQGFTLREIMDSSRGFTLTADTDIMKPQVYDDANDLLDDDDVEDALKNVASSTEKDMLAAPHYKSFDDLATKMRDVEPNGAVKILVLEEGSGPLVPTDGYVHIHYAAYWEKDDVPFDNTLIWNNTEPARLRMGAGAIMPGLEIGLTAVKGPKAQFRLLLAPEAMCGKQGALPRIRPERALFCVTLVGVEDIGMVERFTSLPSEEQKKFSVTMETVEASNAQAKAFFSKKNYPKAITNYHMSLQVLLLGQPETEEQTAKLNELICKVYLNLAICYSKMERPKTVITMCDNVARITPVDRNCQALYLYGKAQAMLGDYEDSLKFFRMALALQPKNSEIAREMAKIDKKLIDSKAQEKSMWKGAFRDGNKKEEVKFNVTSGFKEDTESMLKELSEQEGFVEYRLPARITDDEVGYTKKMVEAFQQLSLREEDLRTGKRYTIYKKN